MDRVRDQARIQDFAQGGATGNRGPEMRGPEARDPKVPPIKNQKVFGFGPLFLVWPVDLLIFLFLLFNFIFSNHPGRGLGPRAPPPPWIRPYQR